MTGLERLKVLADWLESENVPSGRRFNMNDWYTQDSCGTAACAIGWGAVCPALNSEGLGLTPSTLISRHSYPTFDGHYGTGAAEHFFGITRQEAERLFMPDDGYRTKSSVVARIREFIASKEQPCTHG
jgi:hypothetical protein